MSVELGLVEGGQRLVKSWEPSESLQTGDQEGI